MIGANTLGGFAPWTALSPGGHRACPLPSPLVALKVSVFIPDRTILSGPRGGFMATTDILTGPTFLGSTTKTRVFKNFIDGEWVESSTGETFEDRNPADT